LINTKTALLLLLKSLQIEYKLYEHPPIFTAKDAQNMRICEEIPGVHVKNLFLRDKKKTIYLLMTVKENKRVDLLDLEKKLNSERLSFASNHDLTTMLGIQPGSVTPIAIINDKTNRIKLFFDADLLNEEYINIHPMENTATITMKLRDLLAFIQNHHKNKIEFIEILNKNIPMS
jgi:Ala-tRNA(Pro) deacylase